MSGRGGLAEVLALVMAELALVSPSNPERDFLFANGWVPLGTDCQTGLEGWGKVIDRKAVTVDQPEALRIAGWKGAP